MAGLRGQIREPRVDPRARRNSQNLASEVQFTDPSGAIRLNDEGQFFIDLAASGGLEVASSALQIKLDTDPGLALSGTGLTAVVASPLSLTASGVTLTLGDGLIDNAGTLEADLGNGMTIVSGAIEPNPGEGIAVGATISVDINGLTADASPDGAADYVMTYDASAGGLKKVLLDDLPGGGGGSSVLTTKGDILTHDGSSEDRLPLGSNGDVLTADNTQPLGVKWAAQGAASLPGTTKGDTIVYNGTNHVRLPVGSDGQVLTADSSVAEGVAWAAASGGGGSSYTYMDLAGANAKGIEDAVSGYAFDETGGATTCTDDIGSNDGSVNGSPTQGTAGPILGDPATCYTLDGSDDDVDLGNPADLDFAPGSEDFSVSIFFKSNNSDGSDHYIVQKGPPTGTQYRLYLNDNGAFGVGAGHQFLNSAVSNTNTVNDGRWHHGVLVVRNGTMERWYDGELIDSQAAGSTTSTNSITVGANNSGGNRYAGELSMLVFHGRALTRSEIMSLAQRKV